MPTTWPPEVNDVICGMSDVSDAVSMYFSIGKNQLSLPSSPTRDQSTSVASAKYVFAVAAAAIFVCKLSQSVLDQFTLMPVLAVKAAREAGGGGVVASATVMVTPDVFVEPPPPLDEQPAAIKAAPANAAVTRAALGCRRIDVMCPEPSSMTGGAQRPFWATAARVGSRRRRCTDCAFARRCAQSFASVGHLVNAT